MSFANFEGSHFLREQKHQTTKHLNERFEKCPRALVILFMCFPLPQEMDLKRHINFLMTTAKSQDNPAKMFVFSSFSLFPTLE